MFNVTVHSSSGLDVALDMPVHYVRHSRDASASSSMPGKQLRKRLIYGPITTGCSEPYTEFQESLCVIRGPGTSAQTFRVKCTLPEGHPTNQGQVVLIRGTCTRNEIFVTKTVQGHAQANCVSQVNFKFIQVAKTGGFNPAYHANHMLSLPQRDQIDHTGLVATLVASNDFTQAVIADRILLQAVGAASKVDAVNGPSFNDVLRPGGTSDCSSCNTAGLSTIPAGTTAINLAVWFPAAISAAQLYIATYSE